MQKFATFLIGLGLGFIVAPMIVVLWVQADIERDRRRWGYP